MLIKYNPVVGTEFTPKIEYSFGEDVIKATIDNATDTFNFEGLPDGILEVEDSKTCKPTIETELPINPIISAKKFNGELYVELLMYIDSNAYMEEAFPDWMEYKDREELDNELEERRIGGMSSG